MKVPWVRIGGTYRSTMNGAVVALPAFLELP